MAIVDLRPSPSTRTGTSLPYRPDIDGLRAIAVISVIGFHAFPSFVRAGFVGVDIFFVISGYLITSIIISDLREGRFTFVGFYGRRILRIFPALCTVLFSCYLFGWFTLPAREFSDFGRDVAAASGFAANLVFWKVANYWVARPETEPLVHLWSLGIEEQFYFAWPALLHFCWSRKLKIGALLVCVVLTSFALNAFLIDKHPVAVFYLPLTRIWELASGALLAWTRGQMVRDPETSRAYGKADQFFANLTSTLGLCAICACFIFIVPERAFPGWWAVLPVFGTALIISGGPTAWFNRVLLSNRLMVWVGLISYPLYLWHWPFFAFKLNFFNSTAGDLGATIIELAAVLALAAATYTYVERPLKANGWPRTSAFLLVGMSLIGATGLATYYFNGIEGRAVNQSPVTKFIADQQRLFYSPEETRPRRNECAYFDGTAQRAIDQDCLAQGAKGTWLLWGDSFAQSLSSGLSAMTPSGYKLAQITTGYCRLGKDEGVCGESNKYVMTQIGLLKPKVLVIALRDGYEDIDWDQVGAEVKAAGTEKILLVGPAPMWTPSLPAVVARYSLGQKSTYTSVGLSKVPLRTDAYLRRRYGDSRVVSYISLIEGLCNDTGCLTLVPDTLSLTTQDYGHISVAGSSYVAKAVLSKHLEEAHAF